MFSFVSYTSATNTKRWNETIKNSTSTADLHKCSQIMEIKKKEPWSIYFNKTLQKVANFTNSTSQNEHKLRQKYRWNTRFFGNGLIPIDPQLLLPLSDEVSSFLLLTLLDGMLANNNGAEKTKCKKGELGVGFWVEEMANENKIWTCLFSKTRFYCSAYQRWMLLNDDTALLVQITCVFCRWILSIS